MPYTFQVNETQSRVSRIAHVLIQREHGILIKLLFLTPV